MSGRNKSTPIGYRGLQSMVAIRNNNMLYGIAKSYKEKTNHGSDAFPTCIGREEFDLIQELLKSYPAIHPPIQLLKREASNPVGGIKDRILFLFSHINTHFFLDLAVIMWTLRERLASTFPDICSLVLKGHLFYVSPIQL